MLKKCYLILIVICLSVLGGQKTKADDPLGAWIDKLGKNENCPIQGMVDSNGLKSFGRWCFQEQTFRSYLKKYKMFPEAEYKEVMNLIGDTTIQRSLVERMITDDYRNYHHWENTVKKIGLPPKV